MPDALICDNCDKAQRRAGTINWYRVSDAGDMHVGFGLQRIEGTYCSVECLAARANTVVAAVSGASQEGP